MLVHGVSCDRPGIKATFSVKFIGVLFCFFRQQPSSINPVYPERSINLTNPNEGRQRRRQSQFEGAWLLPEQHSTRRSPCKDESETLQWKFDFISAQKDDGRRGKERAGRRGRGAQLHLDWELNHRSEGNSDIGVSLGASVDANSAGVCDSGAAL